MITNNENLYAVYSSNGILSGFQENAGNKITTDSSSQTIGGGESNTIYQGYYSTIPGGTLNVISGSNYASILAGQRGRINNSDGATLLADGQNRTHYGEISNSLALDYANGIYIKNGNYLNNVTSESTTGVFAKIQTGPEFVIGSYIGGPKDGNIVSNSENYYPLTATKMTLLTNNWITGAKYSESGTDKNDRIDSISYISLGYDGIYLRGVNTNQTLDGNPSTGYISINGDVVIESAKDGNRIILNSDDNINLNGALYAKSYFSRGIIDYDITFNTLSNFYTDAGNGINLRSSGANGINLNSVGTSDVITIKSGISLSSSDYNLNLVGEAVSIQSNDSTISLHAENGISLYSDGGDVSFTIYQNYGDFTFNKIPKVFGIDLALSDNVVNLVTNQYVEGLKNFQTTPQVEGVNVALSDNIVDLTNEQYINGLKYFYVTPQVNGTNVALEGSFVDLTNYQEIDGLKYFYTTPQVNGTDVALSNNVVDLSESQNIGGTKDFSSRPTVNGVGVLLIGEAGGSGPDVVYTTGNQVITGNKTFDHSSTTTISNLAFRSTSGQLKTFSFAQQNNEPTQKIDYINDNVWIARSSAYGIYNPQFENGWNSSVSPQGTMWNLDGWNDLSNLDSRDYSGFNSVNGGQLGTYVTGKNFIMKDEVSDRYYKIYFTGWQVGAGNQAGYRGFGYTRQEVGPRAGALLSGQAVFDQRPIVSGKSVLIEGDIQGGGLVSTTGDQNISGLKNFATIPQVNGTGVLLFGQASPSPIEIFGNGSSQGNASSLNFAGGGVSVNTVGAQATITVTSSTQTTTVPTSSNSVGASGAFAISDDYFYFCKRANTWVRTALSTW